MGVHKRESKTYLKVLLSDGTIRQEVPAGTEGAVRRTYEDRETKAEKEKFELVYDMIDGIIGDITIMEGKFGDNVIVPITGDDGQTFLLSLGTAQPFGEDFMKKLPNIDLAKPVALVPFSFTSDKNKLVRGITVYQDFTIVGGQIQGGVKIKNFYYNETEKRATNNFPVPEGDTKKYKTDDWKIYFTIARKFLINDLKERGLIKEGSAEAPDDTVEGQDPNF